MAGKLKALQAWCKRQCEGYRDVNITNMTSSWKSGLAFCAIIHRYCPDLIDYDSLRKEDVYENNKLAFEVAHQKLGIAELLDAEDMVAMPVPDKLCIITYVSQYLNYFRDKEPVGGPGVKGKNAMKRPVPSQPTPASDNKKQNGESYANQSKVVGPSAAKRITLDDKCSLCKQKVYVLERHMDGNRLYHRRCFREEQRSSISPTNKVLHPFSHSSEFSNRKSIHGDPKTARNATTSSSSQIPNFQSSYRPYSAKSNEARTFADTKPATNTRTINVPTSGYLPITTSSQTASSNTSLVKMLQASAKPYKSPLSNTSSVGENVSKFENSETSKLVLNDPSQPLTSTSKKVIHKMDVDVTNGNSVGTGAIDVPSLAKPSVTFQTKNDNSRTNNFTSKAKVNSQKVNPSNSSTSSDNSNLMLSGLLQSLSKVREQQKITDTEYSVLHPNERSEVSMSQKSILKHDASAMVSPTKSILKTSDEENTPPRKKSLSESPTRSILREGAIEIDTPKPILKHKDTADERPVAKERKSRTGKPFLKSPGYSFENTPRMTDRSHSPSKSILKTHNFSTTTDHATDSKSRKPILKSSLDEEVSNGTPQHKSILRSSEECAEKTISEKRNEFRSSSPRSILKRSSESEEPPISLDCENKESHKSILKHIPTSESTSHLSPSKSILKVGSPPTADSSVNHFALASRYGVKPQPDLFTREVKLELDINKGQVSENNEAAKGNSMNSNIHHDTPKDLNKVHHGNRFSAFNLMDSMDLKVTKDEKGTVTNKPAWQVEMEARQGIKQKTVTPISKVDHSSKNTSKDTQISEASKSTNKPEWQLEAEKRQKLRAGKYADPEKFRLNVPTTGISIDKSRRKDSPRRRGKDSPGSTPGCSPRASPYNSPRASPRVPRKETKELISNKSAVSDSPEQVPNKPGKPPTPKKRMSLESTEQLAEWQIEFEKRKAVCNGAEDIKKDGINAQFLPSYGGLDMVNMVRKQKSPAKETEVGKFFPDKAKKEKANAPPRPVTLPTSQKKDNPTAVSEKKSPVRPDRPPPPKIGTPSPTLSSKLSDQKPKTVHSPIHPQPFTSPSNQTQYELPETSVGLKRKVIQPGTRFSFNSNDFEFQKNNSEYAEIPGGDIMPSPVPPSRPSRSWIQNRPLPTIPHCNTPKRRVNAEIRMSTVEIIARLEDIDAQLQELEGEGRIIEEAIRDASSAIETDVSDEDDLMIQWFDLVNQKNELIRNESDLMYRQRQQELEDVHEELEYDLRCLMEIPENEKTSSDKIREESLLKELIETVSLRNNIVDSMEEDRIRYIQEDSEIAEMMELKGFSRRNSSETDVIEKYEKKTKKNSKRKDKKYKQRSIDIPEYNHKSNTESKEKRR